MLLKPLVSLEEALRRAALLSFFIAVPCLLKVELCPSMNVCFAIAQSN
jgi:hypothetical protein